MPKLKGTPVLNLGVKKFEPPPPKIKMLSRHRACVEVVGARGGAWTASSGHGHAFKGASLRKRSYLSCR